MVIRKDRSERFVVDGKGEVRDKDESGGRGSGGRTNSSRGEGVTFRVYSRSSGFLGSGSAGSVTVRGSVIDSSVVESGRQLFGRSVASFFGLCVRSGSSSSGRSFSLIIPSRSSIAVYAEERMKTNGTVVLGRTFDRETILTENGLSSGSAGSTGSSRGRSRGGFSHFDVNLSPIDFGLIESFDGFDSVGFVDESDESVTARRGKNIRIEI